MSNKHMKKYLGSLVFKEAQIKILTMDYFIYIRLAYILKSRSIKCWWGCGTTWSFIHCWWECTFGQPLWLLNLVLGSKIENGPTPWHCHFTHTVCPRETFMCVHQESGKRKFPEALLMSAKKPDRVQCL